MRRRAGVSAVLLTAALAAMSGAPPAPALAAAAAAGGGPTATSEGGAVTITVRIDLCCAADASEQTIYGPLINDEVAQAEAGWNAALAKLPLNECFPIKVVFQARLLNRGEKPNPLAHQIRIDFTRPGRPYSLDPGTNDHTIDTTTVYKQPVEGEFFEPSMSVRTWEHEIGHLMGLGDDYRDNVLGGHGISQPIRDRAGTLMDTGNAIDQELAQRIGGLAIDSGLKLPACWKGVLHAKSSQFFGSAGQCIDEEWDINLVLVVLNGAKVTGKGSGQLVSMPKCSGGGGHWSYESEGHTISCPNIRGRFDGKEFQLQFPMAYPGEQHGTLGGILSLSGEPPGHNPPTLRAQVISPGIAKGQTKTDVIISAAPRHGAGLFDIDLKECDICGK